MVLALKLDRPLANGTRAKRFDAYKVLVEFVHELLGPRLRALC